MPKKYLVTLTDDEREQLGALVTTAKAAARTLTHARILLKADQGPGGPAWTDELIREALEVGRCTVMHVRERFVEEGFAAAVRPRKSAATLPHRFAGLSNAPWVGSAAVVASLKTTDIFPGK